MPALPFLAHCILHPGDSIWEQCQPLEHSITTRHRALLYDHTRHDCKIQAWVPWGTALRVPPLLSASLTYFGCRKTYQIIVVVLSCRTPLFLTLYSFFLLSNTVAGRDSFCTSLPHSSYTGFRKSTLALQASSYLKPGSSHQQYRSQKLGSYQLPMAETLLHNSITSLHNSIKGVI